MGEPSEVVTVRTIAALEAQSCLDAGEATDLTLLSEDQRFRVHISAMAAASDFLAALFGAGMSDSSAREISLVEVAATELQALLELVYHGECSVRCGGLPALLLTAARLQMPTAQRAVEGAIASRLTPANVLDAWELAEQHNFPALRVGAATLAREELDVHLLEATGPFKRTTSLHPGFPRDIPCERGRLQWLRTDYDRGISFEQATAYLAEQRLASGGKLLQGEGFFVGSRRVYGAVPAYKLLVRENRAADVTVFRIIRPAVGFSAPRELRQLAFAEDPSSTEPFKLIAEDDPQLAAGWTRLYEVALTSCVHGPQCKFQYHFGSCSVGKRVLPQSMLVGSAIPYYWHVLKDVVAVREITESKMVARTDDEDDDSESEEEVDVVVGSHLRLSEALLGGKRIFGLPLKSEVSEEQLQSLELREPDPQCWLDTGYPLPKQLRGVV